MVPIRNACMCISVCVCAYLHTYIRYACHCHTLACCPAPTHTYTTAPRSNLVLSRFVLVVVCVSRAFSHALVTPTPPPSWAANIIIDLSHSRAREWSKPEKFSWCCPLGFLLCCCAALLIAVAAAAWLTKFVIICCLLCGRCWCCQFDSLQLSWLDFCFNTLFFFACLATLFFRGAIFRSHSQQSVGSDRGRGGSQLLLSCVRRQRTKFVSFLLMRCAAGDAGSDAGAQRLLCWKIWPRDTYR